MSLKYLILSLPLVTYQGNNTNNAGLIHSKVLKLFPIITLSTKDITFPLHNQSHQGPIKIINALVSPVIKYQQGMHSTSPYIICPWCSINLSSGLASRKVSIGYVLDLLLHCTKPWISWEPESIRQYPMHMPCMKCSAMQPRRKTHAGMRRPYNYR